MFNSIVDKLEAAKPIGVWPDNHEGLYSITLKNDEHDAILRSLRLTNKLSYSLTLSVEMSQAYVDYAGNELHTLLINDNSLKVIIHALRIVAHLQTIENKL